MASLKRSFGSLSSQQSQHDSIIAIQEDSTSSDFGYIFSPAEPHGEPAIDDGSWNSTWQEIFGLTPDNPDLCGQNGFSSQPSASQTSLGGMSEASMESWMMQDLDYQQFENVVKSDEIPQPIACEQHDNFQVCYGMVYRANTRLMGNMQDLLSKLRNDQLPQVRSHLLLGVIRTEERLCIALPDGMLVAELNSQIKDAVDDLIEAGDCSLQALVHKKTIFDAIGSASKLKEAHTRVNLNVYGRHAAASASWYGFGRQLSKHKVWLQRPDWRSPGTTYENPHFLPIGNDALDSSAAVAEETFNGVKDADFQDSVKEVYSMLKRDAHLQRLSGDDRLRKPLLPHQEKALDFMVQRETGPIPDEFSLWESRTNDGQTWYHHKLTGIKSKTLPAETGGGILADEMGMGKTFSMLALIVRSLQDATNWSSDSTTFLADGISPSMRLSHATLVVVPSPLLLKPWKNEIEDKLTVPLNTLVYHGDQKATSLDDIVNHDIVITTYHTLISDAKQDNTIISNIAWYRIVLDEAHFIRRPTTLLHRRSAELHAKFRWCLSGTPIQNRLDDIGALFSFLRIFPFDRMGVFRQSIIVPFNEGNARRNQGIQNLAKLLDSLCIRRTKDLLDLSSSHQITKSVSFTLDEHNQYQKTLEDMKRTMRNAVGDSMRGTRFGLFQAQLQLRLICNHGTFQHQFHWNRAHSSLDMSNSDIREEALALAGRTGEVVCSVCRQTMNPTDIDLVCSSNSPCRHVLCFECKAESREQCPLCDAMGFRQKRDQRKHKRRESALRTEYFRVGGHSSKMQALMTDLQKVDPGDKSIVFSQWTTTLDLIEQHLKYSGINFGRVDGNDDFRHRQKELDQFRVDSTLPVLIMTTGVGAFGLDLTAANRVFLIEPQWNPSVELQAIGRTLRIGQERPVTVTRYIVENTVEKDMQKLQQRKLLMAGMAERDGIRSDQLQIKSEFELSSLNSFS